MLEMKEPVKRKKEIATSKVPAKKQKENGQTESKQVKKSFPPKSTKNFHQNKSKVFANKKNVPAKTEKPVWNEFKLKKKELKVSRKKNKLGNDDALYEIEVKSKKIYEELKMKKSRTNKDELCAKLHEILKKMDYGKVIMNHEKSRMAQLLLKKASHEIKLEIAEQLIPHIVSIMTSKYAQFCVNRMLLYCGKDARDKLVDGLMGNVVKLATSNISSSLVDLIYLKFASENQKTFMRQEFYSDIFKVSKDKNVKSLKDTWAESDVMKKGILSTLKANLVKIASKNLSDNCLVHAVLLEFLQEAKEEEKSEIVTAYSSHLAAISSTKQGTKAARLCYLHSSAKERRGAIKELKPHIQKLCVHEFGHLLVITILNSTDDTMMIRKNLTSSIVTNIKEIADSEFGRRIIYFIADPSNKHFHPGLLQEFETESTSGTQKKDLDIRRKEISEGFGQDLNLKENLENDIEFWLRDGHIARVFSAIMQLHSKCNDEVTKEFEIISRTICNPDWKVLEKKENEVAKDKPKNAKNVVETTKKEIVQMNGIEHAGIHIAVKEIIQLKGFSEQFAAVVEEETIKSWFAINRGCFLLVEILKHFSDEKTKEDFLKILSKNTSELKKFNFAGAKVLQKNIMEN